MTTDIQTIWNNFHKELLAFILNKVRNTADAEDILQEVFIKIIDNSDKINAAGNVRQYIYAMVRNAVMDYFRKIKPAAELIEKAEPLSESESENLNLKIAECCIKPFMNKLPDEYREALQLTEIENHSQKELAEKLNISYSGFKSRVQRGREMLKDMIVKCCMRPGREGEVCECS